VLHKGTTKAGSSVIEYGGVKEGVAEDGIAEEEE
jgi:hypothetical protein